MPTPVPTPLSTSTLKTAWGVPTAITWATTFDSPALLSDGTEIVLGAFELYADTPTLTIYRDRLRMRTNIAARRPYDLTLLPATGRGTLALWLDDDGTGVQTLYAARLNDAGFSERGAISVSSGAATRYTAAVMPDYSVWTIWSVPSAGEATLIRSRLDDSGRARSPQPLRIDADYPSLVVTNSGNVLLFWLEGDRLDLFRAEVTEAGLAQVTSLAAAPWPRSTADQLIRLDTGLDMTHFYIFWLVRAGSGMTEVWMTSGRHAAPSMSAAQRISVSVTSEIAQTGFNHGLAYEARHDPTAHPVSWALPARGQNDTLPAASVFDNSLGILYFQNGVVVAHQTLGRLPRRLIAPPSIATDGNRDLIVAWWLPDTSTEAVLYVVKSGQ